jgi:hypothetical protein
VKPGAEIPTDRSEVAAHMADAMTYLMRVADDSGLDQIMEELLRIRNKLLLISADAEEKWQFRFACLTAGGGTMHGRFRLG